MIGFGYDGEILAIDERRWASMQGVVREVSRGAHFTPEQAAARAGLTVAAPLRPARTAGGRVAVLPLVGFMSHRPSFLSLLFGGTSTALLEAEVRRAAEDPTVDALLLDVSSPGGSVFGAEELAATIASAARRKRVVGVAHAVAASAAYWAVSGVSELVVTPSGEVGSIGVFAVHEDLSELQRRLGVKTTLIFSGARKVDGNSWEPLSAEARADMQRRVDEYAAMMHARIASGRRVSSERVRTGFGEGRVVGATEALNRGMVDRVGTFDETLARLVSGRGPGSGRPVAQQVAEDQRRRFLLAVAGARCYPARTDAERRRRLAAAAR